MPSSLLTSTYSQLGESSRICMTRSRRIALDLARSAGVGPADEGKIGQVAGQADAAADDDVGLGARALSHSPLVLPSSSSSTACFRPVVALSHVPDSDGCDCQACFDTDVCLMPMSTLTATCAVFDLANFVAEFARPARSSRPRRLPSFRAAGGSTRSAGSLLPGPRWGRLPTCSISPWMFSDQRLQLLLEADIVVRAAQAALVAEFEERDAANRAGLLVEPGQLLGRLPHGH